MTRQNNFDIVRLALAFVVVLFHIHHLSGSAPLQSALRFFSGHLAVEGFFAISGFLIFASYERAGSLMDYFVKRAARILPAYWLAAAFCVAIAFSCGHYQVGKFLAANLIFASFLAPSVPGMFETNPGGSAMNGALWTIKIEVMFYIAVPVIVWLGRRLNRDAVLWSLFAASLVYRVAMASHETLSVQLPGQLSFFMIGALIHYHLEFFRRYGMWFMIAAAALYVAHAATGWFALRPAAVATLTLGAALLLPVVKGPTRWGDFSYGTYVLHWPIIQLVTGAGLFARSPWPAAALTLLLVCAGAVLSWFAIEKPSLALAHAYRMRPSIPVIVSS